jgi:RNA polymerase sigma factor (sigma-70 family)
LGQPVVAGVRRNGRPGSEVVRATARIFDEYGGFIRAVIRFQAHNRPDQEDLFQEFFLTLIRKPVPADVRSIKSYLYRAIVSHVLDSARVRENYHRAVKKYSKASRVSINSHLLRNAFIEDREERDATIANYARHLQDREAQAFVLRYRDNCSNGEIAARMGVNAKTVSRYLSESHKRLRGTLALGSAEE